MGTSERSNEDPGREARGRLHKNWHYTFVASLLTMLTCALALLNAAFKVFNISSYSPSDLSVSFILAGYLGMFLTVLLSPVPDYLLLPVYGYLCSLGLFNPYTTLLICVVAAVVPIEYAAGRYAGRALLLKGLSYFRITEHDIRVADDWLIEHGKFSIFIATFIPFFYSIASLAAGTLRMRWVPFLLSSTIGFALRYVFLEYIGFYGIYVFAASFDYSERGFFALLLAISSAYVAGHLIRVFRDEGRISSKLSKYNLG